MWIKPSNNKGIALIAALITLLVLSTLAASIMFMTQAEIKTTYNYKLLTQSRYAAEAGVQRTINWLANSYTAPATFTAYATTAYPVQASSNSQTIVLSGISGVASNYPDSTVQSAFNSALGNQSLTGISNATFSTTATLLRMTPGTGSAIFGGTSGLVPQTWLITSTGSIGADAKVQLQATFDRPSSAIIGYGIAGVGTSCPDVNFTGGTMDSWDSSNGGTYAGTHVNSGGDIGTNGNVTMNVPIYGNVSSSFNTNVGGCSANGITYNGSGSAMSLTPLTQALTYPDPPAPSPATPNSNWNVDSGHPCGNPAAAGCTVSGTSGIIAPGRYGNLTANNAVHFTAGTYYFNTINMNGGSITLDTTPVVINLGGTGVSSGGTLFSAGSSTTINDGNLPSNLMIVSAAGAGFANPPVITMNSSTAMYAVVYAPNAYVHITGSSQFMGAVVGKRITSDSSGGFHFDKALKQSLRNVNSTFVPLNFSWSKF